MTDKDAKRIDYQFVPVPTELLFALDPYCLKAIAVMIDKESYWKSRSKVCNGYFTLSVEELAECLCLENRKDARLTLEALYRAGLIDVKAEAGKRLGAKVKLNWDEMKKERFEAIEKLPRSESITYCTESGGTTGGTADGTTYGTTDDTNCTATLEQEIEIEKEQDIEQEPTAIEEKATPVVPKASFQSVSVEEPRYSYSTSTDNRTEKQKLLDECLKSFLESYKEKIDIQLLKRNPQQFYDYNEIRIVALAQQILIKTHRSISKQGIVLYLKDYVERYGLSQENERTIPA